MNKQTFILAAVAHWFFLVMRGALSLLTRAYEKDSVRKCNFQILRKNFPPIFTASHGKGITQFPLYEGGFYGGARKFCPQWTLYFWPDTRCFIYSLVWPHMPLKIAFGTQLQYQSIWVFGFVISNYLSTMYYILCFDEYYALLIGLIINKIKFLYSKNNQ